MLIAYHPWKHFLLVAPDMQANSMGNMMFVTIGENATFIIFLQMIMKNMKDSSSICIVTCTSAASGISKN